MASTNIAIIKPKFCENSLANQYQVANVKTVVDHFMARNDSATALVVAIHIVPSGGTAVTSNRVMYRTLAGGESYFCPELVGRTLQADESVWASAGLANSVVIAADGRQIT